MNELTYFGTNGKPRVWRVWTEPSEAGADDDDIAYIVFEFGEVDGALQRKRREVKGKNRGRSNATTALEQASKEALKRLKDKEKSIGHEKVAPMLAFEYTQHNRKLIFPCAVQGKLDGERAIFDPSSRQFISRLGNVFKNLEHIAKELVKLDCILDGELYSDSMPFEQLSGLLKRKNKCAEHLFISFNVFDIVSDADFKERLSLLKKLPKYNNTHVVDTVICNEPSGVELLLDKFLKQGFEGIMLRNLLGPYEHKRSYNLQKYKLFQDAEFEIVSAKRENNSNAVVWICKTEAGVEFSARPAETVDARSLTDEQIAQSVGKLLTVKYQELTAKGVPRFPVALRVRA